MPKAILLAACARHCRTPARIGLADVRNHLATPRLLALRCSDVFAMHAYAELYLDGRWVKATPAFSRALCRAFDVAPLGFDGVADSVSMRSIARAKATGSTWPTTCSGTIRICSPAPRGRWAATCRPGPGKMKAIDSHHQPARLPSSVHHR